jgi:hypothetical protein
MSEKMQARISALLRNAEKAGTPEEAATFHAKAQELSALYSIDLELARQAGEQKKAKLVQEFFRVGPDGQRGLGTYMGLLVSIAAVNNVRITGTSDNSQAWLHGFDNDVQTTLALFNTVLAQMVKDSDAYIRSGAFKSETVYQPGRYRKPTKQELADGHPYYRLVWEDGGERPVHGKSARASFQQAYKWKIVSRLKEAATAAQETATHFHADGDTDTLTPGHSSDSVALAIRTKSEAVEMYLEAMNPGMGRSRSLRSSARHSAVASAAGTAAGARARLSASKAIGGHRTELASA